MHRRSFLKTTYVAARFAPLLSAVPDVLSQLKLGAISDSFSQDFETSLRIIASLGLSWVEIRQVFGTYNTEATPIQIRRIKELLHQYRFRVSVIDSALYKCALPGGTPVVSERDAYPYVDQMDLLKRACERGHAWGADKIRGFTFWRVAQPARITDRIAGELEKAAEVAQSAGMRLVIENEESCNAATGAELARILALAPSGNLGINWDVGNGYVHGEASFPQGYEALDKKRIWHLHLKDIACQPGFVSCSEAIAGNGQVPISAQIKQLLRDGFKETMSMECEFQVPGLSHAETSRRTLAALIKILAAA